ncbi:DUF3592 domain-containing protein [Pseudemcibacter aquimaris]|uniref:DUF3592 domain-containing protein n=1 Tax=Pseudemcibacter aquimaris TaxID=2857064 RepID=UPI002012A237|nr:DUF3592 domain-containing protein [Pseudemcibacter aquimaris]MCC3860076.1 DUF3592 domain-containing protein [Pseudemcibacter aquimaris]WDU57405.1 DUF3592 domain-containing protein [Pseudemcibacter aquimaris]
MFDFIFDTLFSFFNTWETLGLLLMGVAFISFGTAFLGYEIYWRLKSERIDGVITAVKAQGKYFYSVFKYKTHDGQELEQDSALGSSSILSRLPGTHVNLMIMPDNPKKIRRPTMIWFVFGTMFLVPGLFIMNLAIKKFEFNYMMALFILAGILFGGEKVFHFYRKITHSKFDRELLSEFWRDIKAGKKPTSEPHEINGEILTKPEIIKHAKSHLKYSKVTTLVLFLISIGLGYWGYYSGQEMIDMTENGLRTSGTIIGMETHDNSDNTGYTYYAIIRFMDENGETHEFTDSIGSSTPLYDRGETVDVLYKPKSPNISIIDRGILNWGISTLAALFSLWALWGSFVFLGAEKRFNNHPIHRSIIT